MSPWMGKGSSDQDDESRTTKAAADLAVLGQAAQDASESLERLVAGAPVWMSPALRLRAAGVQRLCHVLNENTKQLADSLEEERGSPP